MTRGPSHLQQHIAQRTHHPAGPYLDRLRPNGAPVLQATKPWSREEISVALARGSHQSALSHLEFLRDEMADNIEQGYWTILPYSTVLTLSHLRLSPLGIVPQRDRRPRVIVDYTFWGINDDTVPLAPYKAMQFGRAFERTLHKIRRANRRFGPTYMIKVDIADGFYRLFVSAPTVAALGVVFPHHPDEEPLVAFPLVLPMGWVGSPPFFCALTETSTDLANRRLDDPRWQPATHRLSSIADAATNFKPVSRRPAPRLPPSCPGSAALPHTGPPVLSCHPSPGVPATFGCPGPADLPHTGPPVSLGPGTVSQHPGPLTVPPTTGCPGPAAFDPPTGPAPSLSASPVALPTTRPVLPSSCHDTLVVPQLKPSGQPLHAHALTPFARPLAYVDVYMDDFLCLAQGHPGLRERVRSTVFKSIDDVLRPNCNTDSSHRLEPISLSKLAKGDAKWATRKILLGWIVDTVAETIELPEHRRIRLLEILTGLRERRRVSLKDWHKSLGELRSMILAIPGGRGFFSTLQTGFTQSDRHRIRLHQPMRDAITDLHHLWPST